MTRLALLLLAVGIGVWASRYRRTDTTPEPDSDPYGEPVPMTWSVPTGTTYYYNPRTGVLVSAN